MCSVINHVWPLIFGLLALLRAFLSEISLSCDVSWTLKFSKMLSMASFIWINAKVVIFIICSAVDDSTQGW